MKTYIVNLPRCHDRRESILKECARFDLEAEIFPGVDGRELSETELRELVSGQAREHLGRGEIGCAFSHLGIYRDMMGKNIPIALVLEDDSVFNLDPKPLLEELARQPIDDCTGVFLLTRKQSNHYIFHDRHRRQAGSINFYRGWDGYGAYGYIITRKAAANICGFQTPLKFPIDFWRLYQINDLIRLYICEKEIIAIHPELGAVSLLENDRNAGGRARERYFKYIRKHIHNQRPFRLKVKYFFFRLWHGPNLRKGGT